ncbi:methionine--tRNA ligase [Candidatus Parcubacteria bacterium 4484_255]|nr:MAG: methionine--tRNA ligase [Candidatus Parcubacteria bacterium 4484_255]
MKKFYITTPIYYVNDKPHIGHAYSTIAADVLARFHRMKGEKVFFLVGTDEHGAKVAQTAEKEKIKIQELCDRNSAKYKKTWDTLKISYDNFIRTTDPEHEKMVIQFLEKLNNKKLIYKSVYKGLYCIDCERYYTSKELVDGKCPIHKKKVISLSEDCYFFRLSSFQKKLLKLIKSGKLIVEPMERKKELFSFLKLNKIEDLAISRANVKWGISLPWDKKQTAYVWIDALLNYISGLGWDGNASQTPEQWPPDVQLLGKDILRFHAVIWPALLLALDISLPRKLYIHGFFTVNGQKMGKSMGNAIDPEEMATIFGVDALRWLMLSSFPFGHDGDISQSKFYDKYNADLCNGLGNLLRRVLSLAEKVDENFLPSRKIEEKFREEVKVLWENYEIFFNELRFEAITASIQNFIAFCDRYVDENEPWKLLKTDFGKFKSVIYNLLESLRHIAWMVRPFMPDKSDEILKSLSLESSEKKKSFVVGKQWGKTVFGKISQSEILFPRL